MIFTFIDILKLYGLNVEFYIIFLIIVVTTFFLVQWLFKNIIINKRARNLTALTIAVAIPIFYFGLISLVMFQITYTPNKEFDKSQWLTDKEARFQMANEIINSKMLISKDTNQVKEILSDPTWRSDKMWTYDMGFGGGGLGFLFHHLYVKLDNEGKVISVVHVEIRD